MAYFKAKATATEKEDTKTPYIIYWPHTLPRSDTRTSVKPADYIQVVSIDPGTVNYCIRIEKRYFNGWIIPVYYNIWALRKRGKIDTSLPNTIYANLTAKLDEIKDFLVESHMVVIERQLSVNYQSTRVMQHTISYFHIILRDNPLYPIIYDIAPTLKGRMLGAPPKISKTELKEWAVIKARELLEVRQDKWSLSILNSSKKKDDLGDVVCQVEALFVYWGEEPQTHPLPTGANSFHPLNEIKASSSSETKRKIRIKIKQ